MATVTLKTEPTGLDALPEELKSHILSYLNTTPPSWSWQKHTLDINLTCSENQPLKSLSLVSKSWNRLVSPSLLSHLQIQLRGPRNQADTAIETPILASGIKKTTIAFKEWLFYDSGFPHDIRLPYRHCWQDTATDKAVKWAGALDKQLAGLLALLDAKHLKSASNVKSLSVLATNELNDTGLDYIRDEVHCLIATAAFWVRIFEAFDPHRITLLAPPSTLACLLGCSINNQDAYRFPGMAMQLVSVWREPSTTENTNIPSDRNHYDAMAPVELNIGPNEHGRPALASLLYVKPWTHLAVNEGSYFAAYAAYEYFNYRPPGILAPVSRAFRLEMEIVSVAYKALFPFFTHAADPLDMITSVENVRRLDMKVAPGADDDVLSGQRASALDVNDCWREVDQLYSLIINPDTGPNVLQYDGLVSRLEEFGSGDSSISSVRQALNGPLARAGWEMREEGEWTNSAPISREDEPEHGESPDEELAA